MSGVSFSGMQIGRLRFGVAFAVTDRKMEERLPRRGEETEEGNWGKVAKVNYPVQGTPGSLINL